LGIPPALNHYIKYVYTFHNKIVFTSKSFLRIKYKNTSSNYGRCVLRFM